jgi:hypothetical protein
VEAPGASSGDAAPRAAGVGQKEGEDVGLRELGLTPETAVARVEGAHDLQRDVVDDVARRRVAGEHLAGRLRKGARRGDDLRPSVRPRDRRPPAPPRASAAERLAVLVEEALTRSSAATIWSGGR